MTTSMDGPVRCTELDDKFKPAEDIFLHIQAQPHELRTGSDWLAVGRWIHGVALHCTKLDNSTILQQIDMTRSTMHSSEWRETTLLSFSYAGKRDLRMHAWSHNTCTVHTCLHLRHTELVWPGATILCVFHFVCFFQSLSRKPRLALCRAPVWVRRGSRCTSPGNEQVRTTHWSSFGIPTWVHFFDVCVTSPTSLTCFWHTLTFGALVPALFLATAWIRRHLRVHRAVFVVCRELASLELKRETFRLYKRK